jgi:hypothetical protein
MEMASVLAGEPWSDRPRCTHPLLAHLARLVNDCTSDAGRGRLAPHVPSVVGVRGDGLAWEISLTTAVAVEAMPQVPERFERALAVGLLRCEELATGLDAETVEGLDVARRVMADVPHAAAWARRFSSGMPLTAKQFGTRSAPHLMSCAVRGIVDSGAPDTDERLHQLLVTAIDTARRLQAAGRRQAPPEPPVGTSPSAAAWRRTASLSAASTNGVSCAHAPEILSTRPSPGSSRTSRM